MSSEVRDSEEIGPVVRSRKVGCIPAFDGVIRAHWRNTAGSWKGDYFHVENLADGTLWHRDWSELTPATEKEPA